MFDTTGRKPDYALLTVVGILVPIGLVMVYSASFVDAFTLHGSQLYYTWRQLIASLIGIVGLLVAQRLDYRFWRKYSVQLLGATLVLLLFVLVLPASITEVNGARSWIRLGAFSMQPSEIAKLAMIVYFADWLSRRSERLGNVTYGLVPFGVTLGIVCGLVMLEGDLGTTIVLVVIAGVIYFAAGANVLHIAGAAALAAGAFWTMVKIAPYRQERIAAWLDPFAHYQGTGYQPAHALYALGSGGLFGEGLGQARQKFQWLPQAHTDAIFAIIGEEFGLLGTLFVIACFLFIAYRGFRIACCAPDAFAALLATGLTGWLVFQALINIAVVTTLLPFTGLTLPFLSYGGSSLIMCLVAAGILLNISRHTVDRPKAELPNVVRTAGRPIRSAKFFLCGGGTGGHVYPALAVAAALREHAAAEPTNDERRTTNDQQDLRSLVVGHWSVVYVGSADGMEAGLVASESDLPFRAIPAAALRGRSPLTMARNLGTLARGARAARRLIAMERPLAILGTGGYVCVPLFLAARAARVPTAIYLPDVVPGLAVRFLARLATVVVCNVEDSIRHLRFTIYDLRFGNQQSKIENRKSKIVVAGYPVRQELFDQERAACRAAFGLEAQLPALFIYGGSRGARSINQAIAALLPDLLPIAQLIHVCGREGDEVWLREAANQLPAELRARYKLFPYLYSGDQGSGIRDQGSAEQLAAPDPWPLIPGPSIIQAFGAADLALCRSGASTLGELRATGLPAVLVPYPYVHQEENADYLVRRGAALKVRDQEMLGGGRPTAGPLFQNLLRLIADPLERATMSERSKALAQPNAAKRLADLLLALAQSKRATP